MTRKKYYRRPKSSRSGKKDRFREEPDYSKPRIDPVLKPFFQQIGVPAKTAFIPDPFQVEAVEAAMDHDVLVTAPTGSGKTWIASHSIYEYLARNMRVWYASPLKALSNSIYQQFAREFGPENCGIITGDRKENQDAPVIVGTTEILRNQLYDAMHKGVNIRTDLVILDEAHYLNDPDRGVVWEEVMIYLPSRVKLLLLSATISNPHDVCAWLGKIRGTSNRVIQSHIRPVPLKTLFLFPDGLVVPLGSAKGLDPKVKNFLAESSNARGRHGAPDYGKMLKCLRELDLLPAIFFLKSRADCDNAILTCQPSKKDGQKRKIKAVLRSFLVEYPHLKEHRQIEYLLESLVGSHHGGQLPYWKMLIEKLMNQGLLEAIFCTSTVAAGVNFPARTVALLQSDRYNGHEFVDLSVVDLHQMIGRAGRRGKDNIGFALTIPGPYLKPKLVQRLEDASPDPVSSQIHINFSMTLNLLLSHTPIEIKDLLKHSFAAYQYGGLNPELEDRCDDLISKIEKLLPEARCNKDDPGEVYDHMMIRSSLIRGVEARQVSRFREHQESNGTVLTPGRLFLHKNNKVYMVFKTYFDRGRQICASHNILKKDPGKKRKLKLKRVDLNQIQVVFDQIVRIPEDYSRDKLDRIFDEIVLEDLRPVGDAPSEAFPEDDESCRLKERIASLPCEECPHKSICHAEKKNRILRIVEEFKSVIARMEGSGSWLWYSFKRHLRFLKETDFADEHGTLTVDGRWASNLRLDQPLLIAEAIRTGAFENIPPENLAGGLAPFVWDRGQDVEILAGEQDLRPMEDTFGVIQEKIIEIRELKSNRGFQGPPVLYWPAAAVYLWAKGMSWEELIVTVHVSEGDMASLIMRTADHLRQIAALKDTHPEISAVAFKGIESIMREPVYIP